MREHGLARSVDQLPAIRAALLGSLEALAEALLGPPNKAASSKRELRWGGKGSLALVLRGPKRGAWHSHEDVQGGGPLDLVMHARRCGFAEAVEWAAGWIGADGMARAAMQPTRPARSRAREADEEAERSRSRAKAEALWREGLPIHGTLAERYLVGTRGIPAPLGGWPSVVAFHPRRKALMVAATDATGAVQAVQLVHLALDASKIGEAERERRKLPAVKSSHGTVTGHVVRLPGDPAGPLVLAEGPETGLTAWVASGHETWIALGSLAKVQLPTGRRMVACRDDDKRHSPADKAIRVALAAWGATGADVVTASPWPERRFDGSDMNDLVRAEGIAAVRERIARALSTSGARPARVSIQDARQTVDAAVGRFFATALDFDPKLAAAEGRRAPVHGVRTDVGSGKSVAARRHAAEALATLRDRLMGLGFMKVRAPDRRTVVIAVPAHRLGDEQATAFRELRTARRAGLVTATWRGREQPDSAAPGHSMCRNLEAVRDAQDAGLDPEEAACRRKMPDGTVRECPFYKRCGYQKQAQASADLWIVPHELVFSTKPAAIGKPLALVVDERAWQDGLDGVDGKPITLSVDALASDDEVPGKGGALDGARLRDLRRQMLNLLRAHQDGPLRREVLLAVGLKAASAREGRALEYRRMIDPGMHPGMSPEERHAAKQLAAGNRTIHRLAMMWRGVEHLLADGGPALSGWVELATERTENGPVRVLRLMGRREVRKGWLVPTLLMDAGLDPDLNRHHWPDLAMMADVRIETPHMRLRQVEDQAFAKARLEPHPNPDSQEGRRRARRRAELHAIVSREARRHLPGQVLVIAQKVVKEALGLLPALPANVDLAHHNAVAGLDHWKQAAGLIVVGRTQPPPEAMSRMAAALTGRHVPVPAQYVTGDGRREMADGSFRPAEVERHPDPTAEAIRSQACEGELVQIIGRVRAVNRTAADPVDVLVMTSTALPVPVDELVTEASLAPSAFDRMLAAGGIAFENPGDAAAAYPDMWATREAAKSAFSRERLGASSLRESLNGECPQPRSARLARVDYQRAGSGRSPMTAWCDPDLVPDPARAIEAVLGALAFVRVLTPPAPASQPPIGLVPPMVLRRPAAAVLPPLIHPPLLGFWTVKRGRDRPGGLAEAPPWRPAERLRGRSVELLGDAVWAHGWPSSGSRAPL